MLLMTEPDLTLAWEPLSVLLDDGLQALVREHHAEVGVHKDTMPLDCDWEKYHDIESKGILRVLAARLRDRLIGYSSFMVLPHLHYRTTLHGVNDGIFVQRQHRRTRAGLKLIDRAELDLAAEAKPGYCRIVYHDKAFLNYLGPTLRRRGYEHQENIWDRMVRGS